MQACGNRKLKRKNVGTAGSDYLKNGITVLQFVNFFFSFDVVLLSIISFSQVFNHATCIFHAVGHSIIYFQF